MGMQVQPPTTVPGGEWQQGETLGFCHLIYPPAKLARHLRLLDEKIGEPSPNQGHLLGYPSQSPTAGLKVHPSHLQRSGL